MSKNVSNQGAEERREALSQLNHAADDKEMEPEIKTESMEVDPSNGEDGFIVKEEASESLSQVNQASDDDEIKTEFMQVDHPSGYSNGEDASEGVKEEPRESLSQLNQISVDEEIKPEIKTEFMQVDPSNGGVAKEGVKQELTDDQEIKPFAIKTEAMQPKTSSGEVANEDVKQEPRESLSQTNQAAEDEEIKPFAIKTESTQPQPSNGESANEGGIEHAENNMVGLTDLLVASIYGFGLDHFGEDGRDEKKLSDLERRILSNVVRPTGVSAAADGGDNGVVAGNNGSTIVGGFSRPVPGDNERRLAKGKRKCKGDDGVNIQAEFVFKLFGFDVYTYKEEVGKKIAKRVFGAGPSGTGGSPGSGGGRASQGGSYGGAGGSSPNGESASTGSAGEAGSSCGDGEHKY